MENLLDTQENNPVNQLSEVAIKYMRRASGWMIFLAIIGFLMSALMLFAGIAAMTSELLAKFLAAVYFVVAIAGFFINLFWIQSAIYFRKYSLETNMADAENAFIKLNSSVIFSSVVIILYILFIITIIATGSVGELVLGSPL